MGAQPQQLTRPRDWSPWRSSAPYTVGVEEEVMLLDPRDWSLAQRSDEILPQLPAGLVAHVSAETHQAAVELATDPHVRVADAIAQLRSLRVWLGEELARLGLAAGAAGTHPTAVWTETRVSPASRYQVIQRTMADLARREPTFALHVHVGVPDPGPRDPPAQPAARASAATARAVGQLAVLAGPRHRPRVDADDGLRRLPAHRHPAPVRLLRGLGADGRHPAALGRVPRTDVPVVGRAPAACARHGRGARDGRADRPRRDRAASSRSSSRSPASRSRTATWRRSSSRPTRCSRRTASSRPRDGIEADLLDPVPSCAARPARSCAACSTRCAPHADVLGCRDQLERGHRPRARPAFQRQIDAADRRGGDLAGVAEELAAAFAPA
jgi:hypothetical protein